MIYKALRPVGLTHEQVQAAGAMKAVLKAEYDGLAPAAEYVERARPPESPTHNTLPWDDWELGEQKRREVAASIIQVVVEDADTFENVSVLAIIDDVIMRGYATVDEVKDRPEWRGQVEREFLARIRGDCANHSWLPIACKIRDYIDSLKDEKGSLAAD